jgi:replication factor C subunit 3/5
VLLLDCALEPLERQQVVPCCCWIVFRVNTTEGGINAILRLAQGDMRRVLNVLQATSLGFDEVTEAAVYACTGDPSPKDIRRVTNSLLTAPIAETYELMRGMQATKGLALGDVMQGVARVMEHSALPPRAKAALFSDLARIEARLAAGTPDKHQVGALMAAFVRMRDLLEDEPTEGETKEDTTAAAAPAAASSSSSSSSA